MGDIINLRLARKQLHRTKAAILATENRTRFGQTKEEQSLREKQNAHVNRELDGKKRQEFPESKPPQPR